jgi:S-adenosylmethionine-diacylgycerolhomoserine-N-methlytransferase
MDRPDEWATIVVSQPPNGRGPMNTQQALMDRFYRLQRHVYDLTRRVFLPGRDRMLDLMHLQGHETVLEIGCGTARNLVRLARGHPSLRLYGIDASVEMLKTARKKARGYSIVLLHTLAQAFDYASHPDFDVIFFSYSLSMMPGWKGALERALAALQRGGRLYIVDFWDQRDLPAWFGCLLRGWLSLFHVRFEPALLAYLEQLSGRGEIDLEIVPVCKRYAYIVAIEKP